MRKTTVVAVIMIVALALIASVAMAGGLTGKVVETMDSGGYTYILVKNGSTKTWVAIPQTTVKVGQTVTVDGGSLMPNFYSKSLKRTFKSILFAGGVTVK